MKPSTIFDFSSYKKYLLWREQTWPARGLRLKLSQAIPCQPSYISAVFNGDHHLSLEQGAACHAVLGHVPNEAHFFMLLLQHERAGTVALKEYFAEQITRVREERKFIQSRLEHKTEISKSDQNQYYSSHLYALIHIATAIEELNTPEKLAERLHLPIKVVKETLEFLVSCKLFIRKQGKYSISNTAVHLDRESKQVARHHQHWRLKAIENSDFITPQDLHYSSVLSFGLRDWPKLREILVNAIAEIQKNIQDSPCEDLFILNADLFRMKK